MDALGAFNKKSTGCTFCDGWWDGMLDNCDERLTHAQFAAQLNKYWWTLKRHENEVHGAMNKLPGNGKQGNGRHCGEHAFTLTMSPTDIQTEDDMIRAADKLMKQTSCPVKKYAWYLEHKENERHPHIHGIYETETGGRIEAKHFKRAWPIWNEKQKLGMGFRGGYHRPVLESKEYLTYISKDRQKEKHFDYKGYEL